MNDERKTLNDKDRQQYYDTMEGLFGHPGWTMLMEDATKLLEQSRSIESVDAEHSVDFRRGECYNLRWLLSLPDVYAACLADEIKEQESGE